MRVEYYDAAIIGGGPAGSSFANYLAGTGYDICIIEKKNFPRDVICGEFLSKEVIGSLRELNIYTEFLSLNPNPINTFKLIIGSDFSYTTSLDFHAYSIKRSTFDNFLLKEAKRKGVSIIQPAEVKEIIREGGGFIVKIKGGGEDDLSIHTRALIGAYGKQNYLDKYLSRKFSQVSTGIHGIKFHFPMPYIKHYNSSEIHMYSFDGIYCGMNAVDRDIITICYLVKGNYSRSNLREVIIDQISKNKMLSNLFCPGYENIIRSIPIWGTGNIYFGKKHPVENGIYMTGDSAGMIAPISGDGIGMAFQSSKLLAGIIDDYLKGRISKYKSEETYSLEWNSLFRKRIFTSSIIQTILLNRIYRKVSRYILGIHPNILPEIIKITRG